MSVKFDNCIVIPCYNESKNFLFQEYCNYLEKNSDTLLCFVNDGSTDDSQSILHDLNKIFPNQVEIISNINNQGKAEAVRKGILHCNDKFDFQYIAYLDADLAVSLEECSSLTQYFKKNVIL